jgi:hypothetical protein
VRHADSVPAVSAERVQHYRRVFDFDSARIGTLVSGIAVPMQPDADPSPSQPERGGTTLYIGRVELHQGCDVLFDATKIVYQLQPSVRATFVGPIADHMQHAFAAS